MGQLTDRIDHRLHRRSTADERLGVRLVVGLVATFAGAGAFLILLVLVQSEWHPLRQLDVGAADALNRVAAQNARMVSALDMVSNVFDPNVFRVAITLLAVWYLIRRERRHAVWLGATVWGAAMLGFTLKAVVGRARPVVAEPVSTAPGLSFPSGHALGAAVGCGLLLLVVLRYLSRAGRVLAGTLAIAIVLITALARVGLGVHYVSDVLAGIVLGIAWVSVTTWAYLAWRRETGQPVEAPTEVGATEHEPAPIMGKE
jgi:membrane-associated phospholipid phosphatase